MSDRRRTGLGLLASLAAVTVAAAPAAAQKKPNVVVLMSDDAGWGDYRCLPRSARRSDTRRRTSIASPRKARCSPIGMARPAAPRAVPRS